MPRLQFQRIQQAETYYPPDVCDSKWFARIRGLLERAGLLRPGELNEILLVQVDDCCSWNELSGTACFVAGNDPPCEAAVDLPAQIIACPGEILRLAPTLSELTNCFDVAEYRWLVDGFVVRDWSPDPRYSHAVSDAPQDVVVELRCRADASCVASATLRVPSSRPRIAVHSSGSPPTVPGRGARCTR